MYKIRLLKTQRYLYDDDSLYKAAAMGRRAAKTSGGFLYCVIDKDIKIRKNCNILWGDTTISNCKQYAKSKLIPLLNYLGVKYHFDKSEMTIEYNNNLLQFRGASQPKNWEGFGYDIILLNEAGIILKNMDLWNQTISPMLFDNPNSEVLALGTPKGYNGFQTFSNFPNVKLFNYSSYDNEKLDKQKIDELKSMIPKILIEQEIYGHFVQGVGSLVKQENIIYYKHTENYKYDMIVAGVDLAISVDDKSDYTAIAIIGVLDDIIHIIDVERIKTELGHEHFIIDKYKKYGSQTIGIESNQFQKYLTNILQKKEIPVIPIYSTKDKETRFYPVAKKFEDKKVLINSAILDKKELIDGELQSAFIYELLRFPTIQRDDTIDALSIAYTVSNKTINWSYYD